MSTQITVDNMCRTCMKDFSTIKKKIVNKKQSIHEVPTGCLNSISIMELLQVVQPQIKVEMEDKLPMFICSDCVKKLLACYEFIEMYQNVDRKFRKMVKEYHAPNCCNDDFDELEASVQFLQEDNNNYETKYEFEIEAIDVECTAKEEHNSNQWTEFHDDHKKELREETESNELFFQKSHSDASDCEWIPSRSWQTISPKKGNTVHKINDDTLKNKSVKPRKKRKESKVELQIPAENEDGSVSCQLCEIICADVELWQEHMQEHKLTISPKRKYRKTNRKNQSNQKDFECEHCGKGFARLSCYTKHVRIHTGEEPYLCIECGKSFKIISSLNTHMLRHKGEKTFQCRHCPKKFVCSSGLYGHMMVHTKEKPFVCDICGSAFHMAYQLKKHNLYHNGIKNYQCEYCDMRFVTREKQRRHMRTHTGEKPYRCKYCERAFAQSNDCVKHLRQHLGDNVYQCELCPLRFPLARDLRVHFATHKDDSEETRVRNLEARIEEERNLQIKLGFKQLE